MTSRYRLALLLAASCVFANAQEPEAIVHDGRPALRFPGTEGWNVVVDYSEDRGGTFRFPIVHNHDSWTDHTASRGFLEVSKDQVRFSPADTDKPSYRQEAFAVSPSEVKELRAGGEWGWFRIHTKVEGRHYDWWFLPARAAGDRPRQGDIDKQSKKAFLREPGLLYDFFALTVRDFDTAVQKWQRLTLPVTQPNVATAAESKPEKPPEPPKPAAIRVRSNPGGVQVYVDDQFKGVTSSEEGMLVIANLKAGGYRLRITQPGYKDWTSAVTLTAGEEQEIAANLTPAGPKPLALGEIEEALANGLPPKGITKLVNQYGVDFALTKEVEQRLRQKGADNDLLLAIATGKK